MEMLLRVTTKVIPMPILNLPYPVYGKVYDTNGALIGANTLVKLRNNRTNEITSGYTNSNSEYALDAANFSSGYDEDDSLTVYVFSKNSYDEETFLVSSNQHQFNINLVEVSDSTLIYYTTVQNVYDELDGVGATDISAIRVVKAIQRAESEIENRTGKKYTSTTVTQEVYDLNRFTNDMSPETQEFGFGDSGRLDYMWAPYRDRVWLKNKPVVSITTLQRNSAGANSTDSWETLTEQTGSGGDYVLTDEGKAAGYVEFVNKKPRWGKRAMRATYVWGYSTTPKNIEKLTTMMAVRDIILSKISRSFFDSSHPISLRGIMIDRNAAFATYLKSVNEEIDRLWMSIGSDTRMA